MPPVDLGEQLQVALRLVVAALLGAAIGFEREFHGHPAGMRTHLLVSLGSAAFTVLSIFAFATAGAPSGSAPTDPSRIAAQIVSGIGFLGAGAILKYGSSVRGLTTAASLWATAAVGMAAGAGAWLAALVTTILIVLSLGPLNLLIVRFRSRDTHIFRLRIVAGRLEALGDISRAMTASKIDIAAVNSQRLGKGRYEIELDLRRPAGTKDEVIIAAVSSIPGIEILEAAAPVE
jgi:putative Mg2+ transporter-C (MgtC) family protein